MRQYTLFTVDTRFKPHKKMTKYVLGGVKRGITIIHCKYTNTPDPIGSQPIGVEFKIPDIVKMKHLGY